ncbi:MAG TPA: L,D-transpeptidase family protein [Alphaproteobacteria bacterium]|nr:L,D-transpeptidase family protein [Alphaproteobacteria bacterium]
MDISVIGGPPGRGTLLWQGRSYSCTLGRSGVRADKREGDGASPSGCFAVRAVFYRADRLTLPRTRVPLAAIARDDGWCDAPDDPQYNRKVRLPYPASAENLWRDDALYDIVVVLGHNDDPVIPGAGSAIFLHLMRDDGGPTEGCVGVHRALALDLVAALGPEDRICISAG